MKIMVTRLSFVLLILMSTGSGMGQQALLFWTYGYDEKMDYPCSIEQVIDDGNVDPEYVIAGRTEGIYASVLKINYRGIQEWEWQLPAVNFGITPYGDAMSIIYSDNGYIVAGWVTTLDNEDVFLARLDKDGDLDWITTYGGSGCQQATDVCEIVSQETGEITGYAVSAFNQDNQETLLITFDLQGNIEELFTYRRIYCGHGYRPTCILQASDGGFALGGLAGTPHYQPHIGIGFMLKVDASGQPDWFHLSSELDHGCFGQCVIQRPNGNYYLLGAKGPGMYPDATIVEIDQNGDQVGSPRVFTEIADAAGDIQSYGFSLEPFKTEELCYAVCGEITDMWEEDFDLFFMAIDDNLNIEDISIHGLTGVVEATLHSNNTPYTASIACKVFNGRYILTAPTTYRENWPNRDIYLSRHLINSGDETTGISGDNESSQFSIDVGCNPCSETASINISLPIACQVNVSVYDICGRHVGTITEGYMAAGTHLVTWNASDVAGGSVSSGVYFVHLTAGDNSDTGRLVLITN